MEKWHNVGEESQAICAATIGCTSEGFIFPIRCKKWSCPVCAPINAYRWAIEVANGVRAMYCAGQIPKFVTITQPGSVRTAEYAYSILHNQWDKFRNRWQYWAAKQHERWEWKFNVTLNAPTPVRYRDETPTLYAAFVEGQSRRAGMPHFHIIATDVPNVETMRRWCVASGLGYQCDIQTVSGNSGAAWYVSKYSTKSSDAKIMPVGFHRVRLSQDFPRIAWREDAREGNAIARLPRESTQAFAWRAAMTYSLNPDAVIESIEALAEKIGGALDEKVLTDLYVLD